MAAIDVITRAASTPLCAETIALLTDDGSLPIACVVIAGPSRPDDIIHTVELLAEVAEKNGAVHLVLASCRPGRGFGAADIDRWFAIDLLLVDSPLLLVEWFIHDERSIVAMSAVVGEPSRWELLG